MSGKALINNQYVEKYRPSTIEEIILPKRIKSKFINPEGRIILGTNYLFTGSPGVGKTTLAYILLRGYEVKFIEGSVDNGVDTVRSIRDWLSTPSRKGKFKAVIIDEVDRFSLAAQDALRNVAEQTEKYGRFIMTANFPERIIDAIEESRFEKISFDFSKDEHNEVLSQIYKRIACICTNETIKITQNAVIELVKSKYPDMRAIIRTLQTLSVSGETINVEMISSEPDEKQDTDLYELILSNLDQRVFYTFIGTHYMNKDREFYSTLGEPFIKYLLEQGNNKIDKVAVIVHKYMYQSEKVFQKFISTLACAFELAYVLK